MLIISFNKAWEKERKNIEKRLSSQFEHEIKCIDTAIKSTSNNEYKQELLKIRANLQLRKSMVGFESENIASQRMQIKISYLVLSVSFFTLIVSIVIWLFK
jgi:hypothetical protein